MGVERKTEGLTPEQIAKGWRIVTLKINASPTEKAYFRSLRELEEGKITSPKVCGPMNQNYDPNLITIGYDY